MLTQSGASSFFIQGGIAKDERSFGFKATVEGRKKETSQQTSDLEFPFGNEASDIILSLPPVRSEEVFKHVITQ